MGQVCLAPKISSAQGTELGRPTALVFIALDHILSLHCVPISRGSCGGREGTPGLLCGLCLQSHSRVCARVCVCERERTRVSWRKIGNPVARGTVERKREGVDAQESEDDNNNNNNNKGNTNLGFFSPSPV